MASNVSLLSEDQFLCPICLDMFVRPVSTPCGHNFCISCITSYWDNEALCQCPLCKERFDTRPHLKVNTFISELASQFMMLQASDGYIWSSEQLKASSGGVVLCDICTEDQQEAVKSCVECLSSYCSLHLEPHHRAAGLKRHKLVDPLENLEDKLCKEHSHLHVLFCRTDKVLLCDVCASSQHVSHDIVPVSRAYKEMKDLLGDTEDRVQQMIQERQQTVEATKESIDESQRESKDVIASSVQELTMLASEIQKSQAELVQVMEERQKAAEEEADGFISSVEQELAQLQSTATKLRELKQTEDQLHFLQSFPSASLLPPTMDLSSFRFSRQLEIQHVHRCVSSSASQLRTLLQSMSTEINNFSVCEDGTLGYVQRYEVNVLLDPDTAHPLLVISEDRRQVRYSMGSGLWGIQNLKPSMFTEQLAVLGQRGYLARKFYFEVFVGEKTEWCLGVATASVQRRGALIRSPFSGLWAIWFLQDQFETFGCPGVTVHFGRVERVGVFVDYDQGEISFYDVQAARLIYSFTEYVFDEELYPYLNPCDNEYGSNLAPMVIVPVTRTE